MDDFLNIDGEERVVLTRENYERLIDRAHITELKEHLKQEVKNVKFLDSKLKDLDTKLKDNGYEVVELSPWGHFTFHAKGGSLTEFKKLAEKVVKLEKRAVELETKIENMVNLNKQLLKNSIDNYIILGIKFRKN